jgi:HTH-type transcriptional regulator/antitoxin HigA
MDIQPIKSERDYRRTLKEIEGLMSARRDTPQGDRLDALVTLVEAWESGQECSPDERSDIRGGRR